MIRMRFTNIGRSPYGEYRAEIEIDGRTVGRVERGFSQGGFRSNDYRAFAGPTIIATGRTLADLRGELREHFASEHPDARESW